MCPSAFSILISPRLRGGGGGGQTCTKTFLGHVEMCLQNSLGSVHGFGFPLALQIPTDRQTNICTPIFIYIDRYWLCVSLCQSFIHWVYRFLFVTFSSEEPILAPTDRWHLKPWKFYDSIPLECAETIWKWYSTTFNFTKLYFSIEIRLLSLSRQLFPSLEKRHMRMERLRRMEPNKFEKNLNGMSVNLE